MKVLDNVTLVAVDCVDLDRVLLAADICTKEIKFAEVKILTSIASTDPRVVHIKKIKNRDEYSSFMIKELDKYIDTEYALVFQYDGFILNPKAWSDDFLNYDYIGACWYHIGDLRVGNGGFSLRSKRLIKWLSENWSIINNKIDPEDIFISRYAREYLEKDGMRFAPESVASVFSWEGNERTIVWNNQFGFHGGYTDISNWLVKNPQYKDKFRIKYDDYMNLMRKYPIYDGTVHTIHSYKPDLWIHKLVYLNKKQYETRLVNEKYVDYSKIKVGDTLIFKRSGVSFKKWPIPAFERVVKRIETFNTFNDLRKFYPRMLVTYPTKSISKWRWPFLRYLGDYPYPKNKPYIIFWFTDKI